MAIFAEVLTVLLILFLFIIKEIKQDVIKICAKAPLIKLQFNIKYLLHGESEITTL